MTSTNPTAPTDPQPLADVLHQQTAAPSIDQTARAGFARRAAAAVIDCYLCFMVGLLGLFSSVSLINANVAGFPPMRVSLAVSLLSFLIPAGLLTAAPEASRWQTTIGKRIFGLAVTDLRGQRIGWGRSLVRFVVWVGSIAAAFAVAAGLAGVASRRFSLTASEMFTVTCGLFVVLAMPLSLMPLFTPRRQTLHDLVAGTLVVRRPKGAA